MCVIGYEKISHFGIDIMLIMTLKHILFDHFIQEAN